MDEELLQIRRLVIANADRMPNLGRDWYEEGFGRVLAMLASCFRTLAEKKLLQIEDPLIAANHFAGILLWIPMNEAMSWETKGFAKRQSWIATLPRRCRRFSLLIGQDAELRRRRLSSKKS